MKKDNTSFLIILAKLEESEKTEKMPQEQLDSEVEEEGLESQELKELPLKHPQLNRKKAQPNDVGVYWMI